MMHQQVFQDREGCAYAESLLQERKKELRALRARHESELIDLENYSSCRRSLLQAINELETLLQAVRLLSPQLVFVVSNFTNSP